MTTSQPTKATVFLNMIKVSHLAPNGPDDHAHAKACKGALKLVAAIAALPPELGQQHRIRALLQAVESRDQEIIAAHADLADLLSDVECSSALYEAGFTAAFTAHPRFVFAMEEIKRLGKAAACTPENANLFVTMMAYAPDTVVDHAHDLAASMGLLPKVEYVDDAGEPLVTAEQIAAVHGVPVEDVQAHIAKLVSDGVLDEGVIHAGPVHRVQ